MEKHKKDYSVRVIWTVFRIKFFVKLDHYVISKREVNMVLRIIIFVSEKKKGIQDVKQNE